MVAGADCDSCGVQSCVFIDRSITIRICLISFVSYDPSSSSSAHPASGNQDVSLWSSPTSGNIVTEDCHLVRADGSPWSYGNQTSKPSDCNTHVLTSFPVIVANQSQTIVPSYGLSGVFGLGTNGRECVFTILAPHSLTHLKAMADSVNR